MVPSSQNCWLNTSVSRTQMIMKTTASRTNIHGDDTRLNAKNNHNWWRRHIPDIEYSRHGNCKTPGSVSWCITREMRIGAVKPGSGPVKNSSKLAANFCFKGESEDFWEEDSAVSSLAIQHTLFCGGWSGERAGYTFVCIPASVSTQSL